MSALRPYLVICILLLGSKQGIAQTQTQEAERLLASANAVYNEFPDSSLNFCREAMALSKKGNLTEQYAYSLLCEARYQLLKGDLNPALEKINEAIRLFEEKKITRGLGKSYSLKSILMGRLNNDKEEMEYLLKARELYALAKDTDGLKSSTVNLAHAYGMAGDHKNALKLLNELRDLGLPPGKNDFFIEINYGIAYLRKGEHAKAVIHFQNSVNEARKYKMTDSEISGLTSLAECLHKMGKKQEAIHNFNEALELARKNKLLVEEADALNGMVKLLEEDKNFPAAFEALKRLRILKDSLFNIEKIKSLNEIENRLKLAEKEKIIAEQSLVLEKENAELSEIRFKGILLMGGLIVFAAAIAFLFFYLKRTRNLYATIQVQKKEVEFQKELLEVRNKEVTDSINYARYIQEGMLPSEKTIKSLFPENFILYKPKDIVAGDFYWVDRSSDGNCLLAACDCTGHGVPGAMVSIVACNALTRAVNEFKLNDPARIFDKVNALMQEAFSKNDYEIKDGMDGVLMSFDPKTLQLNVAAANNPVWIVGPSLSGGVLSEPEMELSQVFPDKQPIGKYGEEIRPFELKKVTLQKGEMVYAFSDGYADQFGGPKGKKFKYKQLEELLISVAHLPMAEQKQIIDKRFEDWRGKLDQVDDVLLIGVRV